MVRKGIQAIVLLGLCVLAACNKKEPDMPVLPPADGGARVLVVCEGSLGNGNSSLSLYLPEKDSVYEDVYKSANGKSLGDVFQSITAIDSQYLLCVNNSDKVVVINRQTYKTVNLPSAGNNGVIGVNKPRYVLPLGSDKAYVSGLFQDRLTLINPKMQTNYGVILLPYNNPEGMLIKGNIAYIATWDTACRELLTVNTNTDQLGPRIPLAGVAPQSLLEDKLGRIWVLCGNVYQGRQATLACIDPQTGSVVRSYSFPQGADPMRPVFNATRDTLYFLEVNYNGGSTNNGVFRMGIEDASLPTQPFVAAQGFQYFWALGIQPGTGYIYVGDPKGFTQRGSVQVFRPNGTLVTTFPTGVGPGHFLFD